MKLHQIKPYAQDLSKALTSTPPQLTVSQELKNLQALHDKENMWLLVMMIVCVSATALLTIFCPVL